MSIELKWIIQDNKKWIEADEIESKIEINEENKQVKNIKKFFREVIYKSFLNNWDKKIVLIDNDEIEIEEVNIIINELIEVCNKELKINNNQV